jgi:hypothetical protein
MADWLAAIGSLLSAITACLSFGAFIYAMKMQREDSINDVRPELLLLDWKLDDKEVSNIGPYTSIRCSKIKNVGRGPAFDIWCVGLSPSEKGMPITGVFACPYVASGAEEAIEIGFLVNWSDKPAEDATDSFTIRLNYSDLGQRQHSVDIHLVISRRLNYQFGGGKQLVPRLFMTMRRTSIKDDGIFPQMQGKFSKLETWWKEITVDRWEI